MHEKKVLFFLILGCFVKMWAKPAHESRMQLQEAIANCVGDLLKITQKQIVLCAQCLRDKTNKPDDVACMLDGVAGAQNLLFGILQELLEGGSNDRWILASRVQLKNVRTKLQEIHQQCANKKNDTVWWQQLPSCIDEIVPVAAQT
jgi:hypothetical protein